MNLRGSTEVLLAHLLAALALAPGLGCNQRPFPCEGPTPASGHDHGYVQCEGGWSHRVEAAECPNMLPTSGSCSADPNGGSAECVVDTDCKETPYGRCGSDFAGGCVCVYGCVVDADCDDGEICVCGEVIGSCAPASCKEDADCESELCASYDEECGPSGFACQSREDDCASTADCPSGQTCYWTGDHRACVSQTCFIGRPFLIAGAARVAAARERADWAAERAPDLNDLAPGLRAALAEHWTDAGLMEHASVAAFARFALQLLALGAPSELVEGAQAAMADELRHARLCFALAGAYAGRAIGPGPLDPAGALEADEAEILAAAILEGCVGETVAALEALESARCAEDPVVRGVLEGIAADEARHAELAWRFVRWSLARDPAARSLVAEVFAAALALEGVAGASRSELAAHGVLDPSARREVRDAALRDVVGPCFRALLAVAPVASRAA